MGRLNDATIIASETCALDLVRAEYVREVDPGEIVVIDDDGIRSLRPFMRGQRAAASSSTFISRVPTACFTAATSTRCANFKAARSRANARPRQTLSYRYPTRAMRPRWATRKQSGMPFEMGLVRSHYIGRTFIEPRQSIRHFGVKIKFNPVVGLLRGKRIVLIEDSLVRGTTLRKVIPMLRQAGAREVHMRIAAPPTTNSCFYGIDTPTREELLGFSSVDRGDSEIHHGRLPRLSELGWTLLVSRQR